MTGRKQIGIRMTPAQLDEIKRAAARLRMPVSKYMVWCTINRTARDDATTDVARSLSEIERKLDVRLDEREAADVSRFEIMQQELAEGIAQVLAEHRKKVSDGLNQCVAIVKKHAGVSSSDARKSQ